MTFSTIVFGGMFICFCLAYLICEITERFTDGPK
jgi:hypothetical protein